MTMRMSVLATSTQITLLPLALRPDLIQLTEVNENLNKAAAALFNTVVFLHFSLLDANSRVSPSVPGCVCSAKEELTLNLQIEIHQAVRLNTGSEV